MSRIRAPSNLADLVKTTFAKAKANGDVNFYPTQATVLNVNSIPFQLRFSRSLANKPKPPPQPAGADTKAFDPFADPPAALVVATLEPATHYLVLNKFAIVPEHFILATTAFAAQTELLEAADLAAARACVDAYGERDGGLFVFFNSGQHSGASQAHRHLQLLPVDRMREGLPAADAWEPLAERLVRGGDAVQAAVPFACFAARLDPATHGSQADPEGAALHRAYLALYGQACGAGPTDPSGPARISYNLALTREALVVCPRRAEGAGLSAADGREVGRLALNGTVLAGTALVKTEAEWEALRAEPEQLTRALAKI